MNRTFKRHPSPEAVKNNSSALDCDGWLTYAAHGDKRNPESWQIVSKQVRTV